MNFNLPALSFPSVTTVATERQQIPSILQANSLDELRICFGVPISLHQGQCHLAALYDHLYSLKH